MALSHWACGSAGLLKVQPVPRRSLTSWSCALASSRSGDLECLAASRLDGCLPVRFFFSPLTVLVVALTVVPAN